MDALLDRHIAACNNAVLPGRRLQLLIGATAVGWVLPDAADALADYDAIERRDGAVSLHPDMATDLPAISEAMAARGFGRFRGEAFDVRADPDGPVLAQADRGALPVLGIQAIGVHVNGLVRRADGLHLWVAVRAADKRLDPGKLDHIVAGGVSAGMDAAATLIKEAAEEAGMAPDLASRAVHAATIGYAMERDEGLRRDLLQCYDLDLPEDFVPLATDGEVERFELWPIARALERVRTTDDFKFNVNLVLIDLFRRRGLA